MIAVAGLSVRVGPFALREVSFEVPTGEHAFLMGKTGTGKTTLLEAICGLRPVSAGRILLLGRDVTALPPSQRGIGLVPQDGALFQHLTVREHLTFAPTVRGWERAAVEQRVERLADWLRLGPLLHRKPPGLSGGEAQRVALGRALSFEPDILCLDEPLSALDEETRLEMGDVLQTVREHTGVTILHITHSLADARRLADRIFLLCDGQITTAPTDA
jgi:ABC-type sugar transport system ATPase subunit